MKHWVDIVRIALEKLSRSINKNTMTYTLINHTADFGIQVTGADQKELFANAALALFDLITNTHRLTGEKTLTLEVQALDMPDLMVNWLRELLYAWNGKQMLVKKVDIQFISDKNLTAVVTYDRFKPDVHEIKNEIKAVTYHQVCVEQTPEGWNSKIIFDV